MGLFRKRQPLPAPPSITTTWGPSPFPTGDFLTGVPFESFDGRMGELQELVLRGYAAQVLTDPERPTDAYFPLLVVYTEHVKELRTVIPSMLAERLLQKVPVLRSGEYAILAHAGRYELPDSAGWGRLIMSYLLTNHGMNVVAAPLYPIDGPASMAGDSIVLPDTTGDTADLLRRTQGWSVAGPLAT
jgi:hypothetical protein